MGTDTEPTRQTRKRKTQKHLEKEHKARVQDEGTDVKTAGEDDPRQTRVETSRQ